MSIYPTTEKEIKAKMLLDLITRVEEKIYLNGYSPYGPERQMQIENLNKWKSEYFDLLYEIERQKLGQRV